MKFHQLQLHKGSIESNNLSMPITWTEVGNQSNKLAIVLPSYEYTTQGPLLWYSNQVFLEAGFDTLQFHYSMNQFDEEKLPMIVNEMIASFLQQKQQYEEIQFVSIGVGSTIASHFLLHQAYPKVQAIWFSPKIQHPSVHQALSHRSNKGLVLFGEDGDLLYEDEVHLLEEKDHLIIAHVTGANDLLESNLSVDENINIIRSLMKIIESFIKKGKIELNEEKSKIRIYLSIYGDEFPLDEITEKLEIQPSKTYKKGEEIIPPHGRPNPYYKRYYQETCWEYDMDYVESIDLEEQMDLFVRRFYSKIYIINELREKYNLKSHIQVVLEVENGEMPVLTLNKKILSFAHLIKSEYIGFDTYVMPFDENIRFESDGINFKGRKL
ncbi:DUF4279 domain-containing protein [Ornithinibacillus halophilus]|uniref:Uncharacterized protein n=1 Tax=Ornithinibacillus halophilus TaxID=930117 RepID=A0A1M5FUT3_9BACI|nr:DUF4279 domain-containing protein [Ornithinibacillus halophilus]SHF95253.1 protein of unknown function [Ornithinibacillus halophilus]